MAGISGAGEVAGILGALQALRQLGCRATLVICYAVVAAALALLCVLPGRLPQQALLACARASVQGAFGVLYIYTPERYPLKVVIFLACGLVLLSVGYARFGIAPSLAQLDVRSLASLPDAERLPRLRELGEQLTRTYSGTTGMGTSRARARLRSTDWSALARACEGASPTGKRVLVTGAAGFIGMHVAQRLRARGDVVVGLDNFNDYYPVALKRARALSLESLGVPVVEADVADEALLRRLLGTTCRFSHVVHLAAQAGVRYAARNPQSYVHANVAGQVSLFEAVAAAPEPRPAVVYASSSSVYGLNEQHPFSETHAVDRPASLYAATKRADELMAHVYWSVHGLSVTGLRFFTVYG
ncbi:NAD dependent epimerase/dehydratase, partial [Helicosporidium sp. ATCC 50920]